MTQAGEFDLLMGCPFPIHGIGTYRAPKLRELNQKTGIGLEKYNMMLSLFALTTADLIQSVGLESQYKELSAAEKAQFTPFNMITSISVYRELLCEALDFFIIEKATYDLNSNCFFVSQENGERVGTICNENFDELRLVILRANCLSVDSISTPKRFRDKRAKAVFEKIQEARRQKTATAQDDSFSICNVISAVSAKHNSYNLLNIWELTVYQLYDQFLRINLNHQIDVTALRWAAWGKEAFDFNLWYQTTKNKEDIR